MTDSLEDIEETVARAIACKIAAIDHLRALKESSDPARAQKLLSLLQEAIPAGRQYTSGDVVCATMSIVLVLLEEGGLTRADMKVALLAEFIHSTHDQIEAHRAKLAGEQH